MSRQNQSIRTPLTPASILTALFALLVGSVTAAPHNGDLFKLKQPDGTFVEVKVWGDEFYQRVESLDGYTLVRDPKTRWICYAELSDDESDFVSTDIVYQGLAVAKNATPKSRKNGLPLAKKLKLKKETIKKKVARAQKLLLGHAIASESDDAVRRESAASAPAATAPLNGSILGLTLLIDFPDLPGDITRDQVDDYANLEGYSGYGNNGSVMDYFDDISNGFLDYTNHVTEYYTALYDKSYYTKESIDYGIRARELVSEALEDLDDRGFDFSILSTDASGNILAINAFYAGQADNAWAEGLWPHQGWLDPITYDGVTTQSYQICNMGDSLGLSIFCHENGHMICNWPDLYDYGGESSGAGNYCLMAEGASATSTNPVPPNPHYRNLKGWETVIEISTDPHGTLRTHIANSFTTYRYSHPDNPKEFFLLESRIKSGRNANIPDEGLLIWHVDEDGSNQDEQMTPERHYLVSVEQADGLFHLEMGDNRGGDGDLFHAGYKDVFNDDTLPDARWWSGEESDLSISDISAIGASMSFVVRGDLLSITPRDSYTVVGNVGGPFAGNCRTYTLTNGSLVTLEWAVSNTAGWLTVSDSNSILPAGASTTVDVCLAAAADSLPPGIYTDTVTFSDITNGIDILREVELQIIPPNLFVPPLVNPSFEDGILDEGSWGWYVGYPWGEFNGAWLESKSGAVWQGPEPTPFGGNVVRIGHNASIFQEVGIWSPDTDYGITVWMAERYDGGTGPPLGSDLTVELWGGGTTGYAADAAAVPQEADLYDNTGAVRTDFQAFTIADTGSTFGDVTAILSTSEYNAGGLSAGDPLWVRIAVIDQDMSVDDMSIDNVRIVAVDSLPPSPDPAEWQVAPYATATDSITMVAETAIDQSGVEYLFECISGDGHNSPWQDNRTYTDTGLSFLDTYTYRVKTRDKSASNNESGYSVSSSAVATYPADVDIDGSVDIHDFSYISGHWMDTNCDGLSRCNRTDLNADTVVDLSDFILFLEDWMCSDNM